MLLRGQSIGAEPDIGFTPRCAPAGIIIDELEGSRDVLDTSFVVLFYLSDHDEFASPSG